MPYREVTGNLFESLDKLDSIAHGVNCKGVMGAGIALEIKNRFRSTYLAYQQQCESLSLRPGMAYGYGESNLVVWNLATQYIPGPDARLRWIAASVAKMLDYEEEMTIGMPRIGCGIGGLQWPDVRTILKLLGDESSNELVVYSL